MTTRTIWIMVAVLALLIVVAYFVGRMNAKKTDIAIATAPAANPAVTGTRIAMASTDISGTYYGREKPTSVHVGLQWCCSQRDVYGDCKFWEERATSRPCDAVNV